MIRRPLGISLACLITFASASTEAVAKPALFFYPPPVRLPDGSITSSPLTLTVAQATALFPDIREMAGVVVIVNWSQICGVSKSSCDFTIIDKILQYWASRHKKVVLAVATVGFPTKQVDAGKAVFRSATPDWVLDEVKTYSVEAPTLGGINNRRTNQTRYPRYDDPSFIRDVAGLVDRLSVYDGNPTVAELRVSLGVLTEDNPNPVGALKYQFDSFQHSDWVKYCRTMVDVFRSKFHRTELEVDLGVIAWIAVEGSPPERSQAEHLIDYLIMHHVFLAFDGWDDSSAEKVRATPGDGVTRSLQVLMEAKRRGARIGLEAIGPITSDRMMNVNGLIDGIKRFNPDRLVLFSLVPALTKATREGVSESTNLATDFLDVQPNAAKSRSNIPALMRFLDSQ